MNQMQRQHGQKRILAVDDEPDLTRLGSLLWNIMDLR